MSEANTARHVLEAVAEALVRERVRRGIGVEAAAAHAGVEAERLAAAEAAETALNEAELARLAETYGVAVTAFFGGRVTPLQYLAGA